MQKRRKPQKKAAKKPQRKKAAYRKLDGGRKSWAVDRAFHVLNLLIDLFKCSPGELLSRATTAHEFETALKNRHGGYGKVVFGVDYSVRRTADEALDDLLRTSGCPHCAPNGMQPNGERLKLSIEVDEVIRDLKDDTDAAVIRAEALIRKLHKELQA